MSSIYKQAGMMATAAEEIKKIIEALREEASGQMASMEIVKATIPKTTAYNPRPPFSDASTSRPDISFTEVTRAEQKILDSIAWLNGIGQQYPDTVAIAFMAGYTVNGHFNNLRGSLRSKGLVEYASGSTLLTDAGKAQAKGIDVSYTNESLHRPVMERIGTPEQKLLEVLIDAYPKAIDTKDLARLSGYTVNGHFNNIRGKLRSLGLVRYESGATKAESLLFPEG